VTLLFPLLVHALAREVTPSYSTEASSNLVAAATSRPAACGPASLDDAPVLWSRVGRPGGAAYCRLVAGGLARLRTEPAAALGMAERAEKVYPGGTAATLLRARALAALGAYGRAWAAFELVPDQHAHFDGPHPLRDLGVTALATGHYERAAAAYRALVPRASLLGDELQRQKVHVEGALAVMHQGARGAAEAVSYLSELRRGSIFPGLSDYVAATLALALDRQGRSAEARGAVAASEGPWGLAAVLEASLPIDLGDDAVESKDGVSADRTARKIDASKLASAAVIAVSVTDLRSLVAVLAEETAPELAAEQWDSYIRSSAQGPWLAHAEKRLQALRRKNAGR
jgi:tetratricopeptide (TPR) repeat protein